MSGDHTAGTADDDDRPEGVPEALAAVRAGVVGKIRDRFDDALAYWSVELAQLLSR